MIHANHSRIAGLFGIVLILAGCGAGPDTEGGAALRRLTIALPDEPSRLDRRRAVSG